MGLQPSSPNPKHDITFAISLTMSSRKRPATASNDNSDSHHESPVTGLINGKSIREGACVKKRERGMFRCKSVTESCQMAPQKERKEGRQWPSDVGWPPKQLVGFHPHLMYASSSSTCQRKAIFFSPEGIFRHLARHCLGLQFIAADPQMLGDYPKDTEKGTSVDKLQRR